MATVTLNGSRLNDAESSTGYANFVGGGPAPASEPQLKYQGANAVNRKVNSTTDRRGVEYSHGSTTDMTGASFPLWLCKIKVGDAADLNSTYGIEAVIGSATSAYYSYNLSGGGANNDQFVDGYNSQGGLAEGYLIVAINPNIAQWREGTTGSPVLSAVDYFGFGAQFTTGGAKSENVAIDSIDVGIGLNYTGANFTFQDGVDSDQGTVNNRWGFACANGVVITLRGTHEIGTGGVATTGDDSSIVVFPDGYHGTGDCGIAYDSSNAGTTSSLNGTYIGLGRIYAADDTRPDFVCTGTSGGGTHSGTFTNFRLIALASGHTLDGATLECAELTQANSLIQNSTIQTDSASGVATLDDPDFVNLSNVTFIQSNTGHAIEVSAGGSYNLDALFFQGYGADGSNDASIYISTTSAVTLNIINGGETPTIRHSGTAPTINNSRTFTISGLPNPTKVVLMDNAFSNPEDPGATLDVQNVTSGTYTYSFNAGINVTSRYRLINIESVIIENLQILNNDNIAIPFTEIVDRGYNNP